MFLFNGLFLVLPLNTEGRIRDDIVESIALKLVIAKGVTMTHIVGIATLNEHVGLSNSKGLFVQFLSKLSNLCLRIYLQELFREAVEHLTGSHRHIIDGSCDTLLLQLLTLWSHQEFSHHIDDISCRKVCSSLLVVALRELAYQLFKDVAHIHSANLISTHIGLFAAELLNDVVKNTVVVELGNFLVKIKLLDDIHHILRKMV